MPLLPGSFETRLRRYDRAPALLIAFVYFLLMTILSFKYHIIGGYGVETDFYIFVSQARHIFEGQFPIDGARGPVYFIVLAAFERVFHDFFKSGMIIGLLSAGTFLYLTYRLLSVLFRRDVALVVTLLTCLNPVFVQHTYSSGTDMLFAALAAGAIYYSLGHWPLGYGHLLVSGVLCGVTYLTRFNGVFILIGLALGILVFSDRDSGRVKWIGRPVILFAAFLATISPWGLYCLQQKGDFFYNTNYQNIAYAVYAEGKVGWDEFWVNRAAEYGSFSDVLFSNPTVVLATLLKNIPTHLLKDMGTLLGWHIGVFALLGLIVTMARKPKNVQIVYFLLNALFFLVLLTVFYNPRFSLFLIPIYSLLGMWGLLFLVRVFAGRIRSGSRLAGVVVLVLLSWTFVQSYRFNKDVIVRGPGEILSLARWFKANVPELERGKLIVARKPHIAYYLDLEFEWLPDAENIEELVEKVRETGADYLYFSYMEASRRPKLQALLDPTSTHPGLQQLVHSKAPPAVLYAVE